MKDKKLSSTQLEKAKRQIIGQITLSEENNCNVMLGLGKSMLLYNKVDDLKDTFNKIEAITRDELQEISNEIFDQNQLSKLVFLPKD